MRQEARREDAQDARPARARRARERAGRRRIGGGGRRRDLAHARRRHADQFGYLWAVVAQHLAGSDLKKRHPAEGCETLLQRGKTPHGRCLPGFRATLADRTATRSGWSFVVTQVLAVAGDDPLVIVEAVLATARASVPVPSFVDEDESVTLAYLTGSALETSAQ